MSCEWIYSSGIVAASKYDFSILWWDLLSKNMWMRQVATLFFFFFMLFVFYYKRVHSLIFSQSAHMLDPHCHFVLEAKVCV